MRKIMLLPLFSVFLIGCDTQPKKTDTRDTTRDSTARTYDSDNTGRNVRDRDSSAILPTDQSESSADRTISQNIRSALMKDDSLSSNAKNIKVITSDGVVILRGPVNNGNEKNRVLVIIRGVSGVKNVNDQIEIVERR